MASALTNSIAVPLMFKLSEKLRKDDGYQEYQMISKAIILFN
jgi:hypothetical protein